MVLESWKYYLQQDWSLGVCYLTQGAILTLPDVALRIFLAESLGLSPAQVQLVYAFMLIPWLCKPLYGFISDTFPIYGYRRSPYLIISQIMTIACWFFLSLVSYFDPNNKSPDEEDDEVLNENIKYYLIILGLIGLYGESLFICVSGVVLDSIMVERVHEKEVGKQELGQLQSFCTLWKIIGTLIASIFSGSLTDHFEIYQVFLFTALLPIIEISCSLFFNETRVDSAYSSNDNSNDDHVVEENFFAKLKKILFAIVNQAKFIFSHLFYESSLWKPTLFILFVSSTPSAYSAFYYYLYYDVGVTPTQFGIMMFITSVASFLGTFNLTFPFLKNN